MAKNTNRTDGRQNGGQEPAPSTQDVSDKIEELIEEEKWSEARELIERELKDDPEDHWLLTRLSTTYYEQREYDKALESAQKARKLAPNCPLVLWDLAGAYSALGQDREAIGVYLTIIEGGPFKADEEECSEGLEWAFGLVTDCHYRVGVCWQDLNESWPAVPWLLRYLDLWGLGAQSIYDPEMARKRLGKDEDLSLRWLAAVASEGARGGMSPLSAPFPYFRDFWRWELAKRKAGRQE